MPTVVVILPSTTYRAAQFIKAADSLGVDLIVASENPAPLDMGDRYLMIDCSNAQHSAERIVNLGDRAQIDGVVAADDRGVVIAAVASAKLGLLGNDPEAAQATRDKYLLRHLLAKAEVPQPSFALVPAKTDPAASAEGLSFPLVAKPLDRSAGQGVVGIESSEELAERIDEVRRIVGHESGLIIEEMVEGREVAIEGIVANGELTTLAVFDKPQASTGPYFPETILVTPSLLEPATQEECVRVAAASVTALGINHGPVHIELMVSDDKVSVIEVAARSVGGMCSQSLHFGLMGTTLETIILRNALGLDKPELRRERLASGVLMIPIPRSGIFEGIANLDEVAGLPLITDVEMTVPAGTRLDPAPVGDRYLGFVFARGEEPDKVTASLARARDILEVTMR